MVQNVFLIENENHKISLLEIDNRGDYIEEVVHIRVVLVQVEFEVVPLVYDHLMPEKLIFF